MDLFTHILIAYLLTFGIVGPQPAYLAAGALAGGLPDADVLFFPLARRFPILRHHGITHSVLGVTIVAVAGALVAPHLAAGAPIVYFAVMEVGGLGHMLSDGFTHYSVPPLLPFSERPLELDADRAINFVTLVVSVAAFYLLLGVERGHAAPAVYLATVYGLMAFYGGYLGLRLAARLYVGRRLAALGPYRVPVPTTSPFTWILLNEVRADGWETTTFGEWRVGRGVVRGPFTVAGRLDPAPGPAGPVVDAADALARSLPLARRASGVFDRTYHFGEARRAADGGWTVAWYSLEFTAFGRAAGATVRFATDGSATARRAWPVPGWRRAGAG